MHENQSPKSNSETTGSFQEKKMLLIAGAVIIVLVLIIIVGISAYFIGKYISDKTDNTIAEKLSSDIDTTNLEEDMIFKEETEAIPNWIQDNPNSENKGPWYSGLYISESTDGLNFTNEKLFLEHSGVANLIVTSDNKLIATFQYFSFVNQDMFDIIAYTVSEDNGKTWSSVKPVNITGLSAGESPNGCDPTLVELEEGRFRLYFTYHQVGEEYPQLFSAIGDSIDSKFLSEGQQLLTDEIILDPAVIYFDDMWHHYTVKHGESFENEPNENPISVHSTSEDGLAFELVDEITLDMQFLGDVIEDDGGIRFYNGSDSAFSTDGYNWVQDEGERVQGADPGVVKLDDGTYLIIYTKVN